MTSFMRQIIQLTCKWLMVRRPIWRQNWICFIFCSFAWGPLAQSQTVPEGVIVGAVLYSPFEYRRAWDENRQPFPIGGDLIQQFNTALNAAFGPPPGDHWVGGSYQADYEFFTFDLYAGLTQRSTFHFQIPYYRSQVRQRVDIFAPPPLAGVINSQLEALDIRDETLNGSGFGDAHLWLYHQYANTDRWKLTAGIGWRTALLANTYAQNTEKLNVGTRESEALLLNHVTNVGLLPNLRLNYRLELQVPFAGKRDIFQPGVGVVNVSHTPGRYLTHELEARSDWFNERFIATFGVWYRDESRSKIGGVRDTTGKDYLWHKYAVAYSGMTDYEKGTLPIPFYVELRYWDMKRARNTRAYADSYWEVWFALPLWRR
jgi:hypothetical protein